jgi:hypothetical protein
MKASRRSAQRSSTESVRQCAHGKVRACARTHVVGLKHAVEAGSLVRTHGSDHVHVTLVEEDLVVVRCFTDHVPDCKRASAAYASQLVSEQQQAQGQEGCK